MPFSYVRHNHFVAPLALVLASLASGTRVGAQEVVLVEGAVADASSGSPIEGASIVFVSANGTPAANVVSDANGEFQVSLPPDGSYLMSITRLGYLSPEASSIEVEQRSMRLRITLDETAVVLDPIEVTVSGRALRLERAGFFERQESTSGYFITRDAIEEENPRQITQLLERVPGIRSVRMQEEGARFRRLQMRSADMMGGGNCLPRLIIDGHQIRAGGSFRNGGMANAASAAIDDYVNPDDIEGIEVYRSPVELPPRFGGVQAGCGAIVIWTR
jgi:hypothetical protein